MEYFEPIPGDDLAVWTAVYRDVPEPFRLVNAWNVLTDTLPIMQSRKDAIIANFDRYYARQEINGETYQDFLDGLVETLVLNADTIERLLEVYNDDIAKPILGREEVRTLSVTELGTSDGDTSNVDIPADNVIDDKPTSRSKSGVKSNVARDETETTHLSDLGVRPNYETLNGFIDNNRTIYNVFNKLFHNNFINFRAWYKW